MGSKKQFTRKWGLLRGGGRGDLRAGDTGPSALPDCRGPGPSGITTTSWEDSNEAVVAVCFIICWSRSKGWKKRVKGRQRDERGGPSASTKGLPTPGWEGRKFRLEGAAASLSLAVARMRGTQALGAAEHPQTSKWAYPCLPGGGSQVHILGSWAQVSCHAKEWFEGLDGALGLPVTSTNPSRKSSSDIIPSLPSHNNLLYIINL